MKISQLVIILATGLVSAIGEARPRYLNNFYDFYEDKGANIDQLETFQCGICHINPRGRGTRTEYGNDFIAARRNFDVIEMNDSDGDGISNLDEIMAGTNPGDAKSN